MNTSLLKVPIMAWLLTVFLCYSNIVFSGDSHTLIPGLVGDALTVEQDKNFDNSYANTVTFTSDLSLWYALQKKGVFESEQGWWNAFSKPDLIEPQLGILGGEKITKGITLEPEFYSVYNNNPRYWFDLPETMNWIALINAILEGATGVKGVLYFRKLVDKIPSIEHVKDTYEEHKKKLQLLVSSLNLTVETICAVNDGWLTEKGVTSELDQWCGPIKKNLKTVWNALGGTGGMSDTLLGAKEDFGDADFQRLKSIFDSAKNVKKLSDLKNKFWPSVKAQLQEEIALILPTWAVETSIKTCMTGGEETFSNVDETVDWNVRAVAKYIVMGRSLTNQEYESLAPFDFVFQANKVFYLKKYNKYEKYAQAGRNALLSNYLRSPSTFKACTLGQLEHINELPKLLDKLAQLANIVTKLKNSMSNVEQVDVFLFLQFLVNEALDFGKEEAFTLAKNLFKSVTPARFYRMGSAVNTGTGMAWDAVTKPSRVDFEVTNGNNNEFSFATALPPLDHIRYLAIPKECVKPTKDENGKESCGAYYNGDDYILDVVKNPELGVDYFSNDAGKWEEDISAEQGDEYTYIGAYTLSTDPQNNHFLLMSGAKLSVENKAGVRDDSNVISQVKSFFKADKRDVIVDWHSYRYMDSSEFPVDLERTKNTAFNGQYYLLKKEPSEFNCPPGDWNWCIDDNKYYEEYFNKKATWSNPVLEAYMEEYELLKLNFIDFSRIYLTEHKGGLQHLTPGIYLDSTKIALGDAGYTAAFHAYVMIDYDAYTNNEGGESHRSRLLEQSQRIVDNNNLIGINLQLQREQYFNYWGVSTNFPNRVNVDKYPFYVVIKMGEQWAGPVGINLGDGTPHYVPLPNQAGTNVSSIFVYDTVLHNYIQATGRTVRELLTVPKLMYRKEEGKDARPFILFQPSEVNNVVTAFTNNVDADSDNVPDIFDLWKYDDRYAFDSDNDGIADAWEKINGLDPLKFEDGAEYLQQFQEDLSTEPSKFLEPVSSEDVNPGCYDYGKYVSEMGGYHLGKDYCTKNDANAPVLAANYGKVVAVITGNNHGFGNTVIIEHPLTRVIDKGNLGDDNKVYTFYAHLDSISVIEDECVSIWQQIGTVGKTGSGSNDIVHMHYEIKMLGINGIPNPNGLEIGTHFGYDINHPDEIGFFNPNTFINNPDWQTEGTDCPGTVEPPPSITVRTLDKENGDLQISGKDLGTGGTITVDGKAVQGEWTTNGISLNTGITLDNLEQPVRIKVVDNNGNEVVNICYPFVDVCPSSWYARAVTTLWKKGIVNGYGGDWEGYFRPQKPASRAELVAVVVYTLEQGNTQEPLTEPPFADVSIDDWFAVYVQYAKDTGLIQGCEPDNNLFCPGDPISRAAATKVVAAFLSDTLAAFENGKQPTSLFPDVTDPDDWFYPYIYAAQAKNVVHGYPDGYFKPGQVMTRAEMAKVVCIAAFGVRECSEMGETDRPYVFAVAPDTATLNESTVFTVEGFNLPAETAFWIAECENVTPLSGGTPEQRQFECTPSHTAGIKNGVVKDKSGGTELVAFAVEVKEAQPDITVTSVSPLTVTLNQSTVFTVVGTNLPETTAFWIGDCADVVSLGGTPEQRQFQCTPSWTTGVKEGVVKDQSGGTALFNFTVTVQEGGSTCTTPTVTSVSPLTVTLNERTTFTVYGSCLSDTTAFWIHQCADQVSLGGTTEQRQFECTPSFEAGVKNGIVKDKSGGEELHSFTVEVH